MNKFICGEVAGLQRETSPKNELFHGFYFQGFCRFSGITFLTVLNHDKQIKDEKKERY